jgi:hypothetical protein
MVDLPAGRLRWFLVFWLFVLGAVSYLDRVNMSIAGSAMAEDYRLTQIQLGSNCLQVQIVSRLAHLGAR